MWMIKLIFLGISIIRIEASLSDFEGKEYDRKAFLLFDDPAFQPPFTFKPKRSPQFERVQKSEPKWEHAFQSPFMFKPKQSPQFKRIKESEPIREHASLTRSQSFDPLDSHCSQERPFHVDDAAMAQGKMGLFRARSVDGNTAGMGIGTNRRYRMRQDTSQFGNEQSFDELFDDEREGTGDEI